MNTEVTAVDGAEDASAGVMSEAITAPASLTKLSDSEPIQFELMTRLAQLEEALLARDPMMKIHLGAIHKQLIQHEELVHLLTDEEIGKIVGDQQAHTNTILIVESTSKKGKTATANRTAKLGMADL
jgi:hypothetical protein